MPARSSTGPTVGYYRNFLDAHEASRAPAEAVPDLVKSLFRDLMEPMSANAETRRLVLAGLVWLVAEIREDGARSVNRKAEQCER